MLTTYSRFEESPPESVVELTDAGYVVVGDKAQVKQGDRAAVIVGILPANGNGLTADEVRSAWPTEPKPGKRGLETDLADGAAKGRWVKTGSGVKGDPYRFRRPNGFDSRKPHSLGARIESETTEPPEPPAAEDTPDAPDEGGWEVA